MQADQVKNSSVQKTASAPSKTSPDVVADWLMLYAQAYREEITEELILFYQESLNDLPPAILHRAFLRAGKTCKFRPTPAEIRIAAEIEFEQQPQPAQLPEPQLTPQERDAAMKETEKFRTKLKETLGLMNKPKKKPTPIHIQKQELRKRGFLK